MATMNTALNSTSGRSLQFPGTRRNAAQSWACLYEDRGRTDRTIEVCYQRMSRRLPQIDPAARLYSSRMPTHLGTCTTTKKLAERQDRLAQILSVPVTDFELSVRSRNCLQKMGVMTLGDLDTAFPSRNCYRVRTFGETSLVEIREMLHSKGLGTGPICE